MSSAKRLTERSLRPFAGSSVDRRAGTIANVVICGFESANGRDYPAPVFKRDFAKYEGRPVNADHAQSATVDRRLGWFSGVKVGEDGKPRGTLNLLKSHPLYERVMEAAERNPALFGFSHVAYCKTRTERGREVVEAIERVESIDLVADPATTKGLYESTARRTGVASTLRAVIEKFRGKLKEQRQQKAARKLLLASEDDAGMGAMMDAPVEDPADDADGGDAIDDAFSQLMHASLDKLLDDSHSLNDFISHIRTLYKTRAQVTGSGSTDAGAGSGSGDDDDDDPPSEGKKPSLAGVLKECETAGFVATTADLAVLTEMPSKTGRAAYIERLKKTTEGAGAEKPKSGGRAGTQTTRTAPTSEAKLPETPEAFAKRYRE